MNPEEKVITFEQAKDLFNRLIDNDIDMPDVEYLWKTRIRELVKHSEVESASYYPAYNKDELLGLIFGITKDCLL
jgi:hypothetical protein